MKDAGTRQQRLHAKALERRAVRTGAWGGWEITDLPNGIPGGTGWCRQVGKVAKNDLYAVLIRQIKTEWGLVYHLAIRTASNLEPPWRDKQRIKNGLFGEQFTAVEVMPPQAELIDEADMYHMWVLPADFLLPFTIGKREP